MKEVKFTEYGKLFSAIMLIVLALIALSYFSQAGSEPLTFTPFILLSLLFSFLILLFYKLTITIEKGKLTFIYGIGLIKITKKIDTINSIEELKTPWYWGLGIRMTPKGWLYNIQSRETLEINYTKDGKKANLLIGSNQRGELKASILDATQTSSNASL